jgi:hypothetical protein
MNFFAKPVPIPDQVRNMLFGIMREANPGRLAEIETRLGGSDG